MPNLLHCSNKLTSIHTYKHNETLHLFQALYYHVIVCEGRDLIGVQNLMKKHQALQAELAGHDSRIGEVCEQGEAMINDKHFASDDIRAKIEGLQDRWNQLKVRSVSDTSNGT